jgi:hypothetical protein
VTAICTCVSFYILLKKDTQPDAEAQIYMAIFIRGNINQGDDCFDVESRGAFNSLLGLLTAL